LRGHFSLRLNGFQPGDHLVSGDLVAFLDEYVDQPAHGVGADVNVLERFDLPGRSDHSREILANRPACLNHYDSALIISIPRVRATRNHEQAHDAGDDFPFSLHKNTPSPARFIRTGTRNCSELLS